MATKHNIQNSQFVSIEQTPASVLHRFLAYVIDTLVMYAYFYLVGQLQIIFNIVDTTVGEWAFVILCIIPCFYSLICEQCFNGVTLGKKLMHLRVVMLNGESVTFTASVLRCMLSIIDYWFFCIGAVVIFCNRKHQRLGDLAAGAIVISERSVSSSYDPLKRFKSLPEDYQPVYAFAADFTWNQISLINATRLPLRRLAAKVASGKRAEQVRLLSHKIATLYGVDEAGIEPNDFLWTLCDDYYYFQKLRVKN